jgi:hypothetical protein
VSDAQAAKRLADRVAREGPLGYELFRLCAELEVQPGDDLRVALLGAGLWASNRAGNRVLIQKAPRANRCEVCEVPTGRRIRCTICRKLICRLCVAVSVQTYGGTVFCRECDN